MEVGLPGDPSGDVEPEMPVPKGLNYETWLGSTPYVYYTEKRVHPRSGYDRPGWLRCEQFGAGMITGWGAHHVDSAHWGMDTEFTGPVEIWGSAKFPTKGLWDVHGDFKTYGRYANGVTMVISGDFPNGIKFIGSEGWIFVSRGNEAVTASDPVAKLQDNTALAASDSKIIKSVIGPGEIHLSESSEHHGNWLESIRSRREPIAPVEIAPPLVLDVPAPSHRHEGKPQAVLGSGQGTLSQRRRGERDAVTTDARAICAMTDRP